MTQAASGIARRPSTSAAGSKEMGVDEIREVPDFGILLIRILPFRVLY